MNRFGGFTLPGMCTTIVGSRGGGKKLEREAMPGKNDDAYWKANIRLVLSLLAVWFLVSFGAGILLVEVLDNIRVGGFKLGFWMAQQGSIFVFIVLIFVYINRMDTLDERYRRSESDREDSTQ